MCPVTGRFATFGGTLLEIKLTLATKGNPAKLRGLDSTVGVITDKDNNVLCLVPMNRMEWVFDCIAAKSKTDRLFSRLMRQENRVCTECKVKSESWDGSPKADVFGSHKKDRRQRKQDRFAV